MTPGLRKLALAVHLTLSVGWSGAVAAYLALDVTTVTSRDAQTLRAAYLGMEMIARSVIVPPQRDPQPRRACQRQPAQQPRAAHAEQDRQPGQGGGDAHRRPRRAARASARRTASTSSVSICSTKRTSTAARSSAPASASASSDAVYASRLATGVYR